MDTMRAALDDDGLARELAGAAGELLLALRQQSQLMEPGILRAEGDRRSHEFLMEQLATLRPADAVLSEEGADDPARLQADRVWIVDPLDGTREFGEVPRVDWAVHVALWERARCPPGPWRDRPCGRPSGRAVGPPSRRGSPGPCAWQ